MRKRINHVDGQKYGVKVYDAEKMTFFEVNQSSVETEGEMLVSLFSKKRVVKKRLSIPELQYTLLKNNNYRIVLISSNGCKNSIYNMLGTVSEIKGVSSPFLEDNNNILYFPKLRYSDLGLIRHFCDLEQKREYKLRMVSSI